MKELFIEAHDELITEYLEAHPDASERDAYAATAHAADERFREKLGDLTDRAMQAHKDGAFQ
jgi:hypothetical protein